ncbi:MAG TPA: hypothetical protein VHG08_20195 [Longimicrobium sp.]|nr:hypothetical protein [Longimicrobium sp.]
MTKPRTAGRRALAYFLFFLAFLFALAFLGGGSDWHVSLFSCAVAATAAWLILRSVRRDLEGNQEAAHIQRQLAVLKLAEAEDGQLTVTEVAAKLGWSLDEAAATLRSLDDGVRVTTTLTDDGIMLYDFPELIHDPGRRNRQR